MDDLKRRLKDVFGTPTPDHDWCDTTRLANPWSVLRGRRRAGQQAADRRDGARDEGGTGDGTSDATDLPDLREAGTGTGGA